MEKRDSFAIVDINISDTDKNVADKFDDDIEKKNPFTTVIKIRKLMSPHYFIVRPHSTEYHLFVILRCQGQYQLVVCNI